MVTDSPSSPPPYMSTVATQILLFFALYLSLNIGDPSLNYRNLSASESPFYYFLTAAGGFRPLPQQTLLLKQMEKVVRSYNAQFILSIGELGKEDPLLQNGTGNFPYLRIPWYATKTSEAGNAAGCLSKQIDLPMGRILEIISLDTNLSQVALHASTSNSQFEQFARILKATDSYWKIVVGLNPLEDCTETNDPHEANPIYKPLHGMFSRYEVNAYLSAHGCKETKTGGVTYMSHPGSIGEGSYGFSKEASDGFLLHKVSLLEIETYHVNLDGNVVRKTVLHQRGHEAI